MGLTSKTHKNFSVFGPLLLVRTGKSLVTLRVRGEAVVVYLFYGQRCLQFQDVQIYRDTSIKPTLPPHPHLTLPPGSRLCPSSPSPTPFRPLCSGRRVMCFKLSLEQKTDYVLLSVHRLHCRDCGMGVGGVGVCQISVKGMREASTKEAMTISKRSILFCVFGVPFREHRSVCCCCCFVLFCFS